MSRKAALRGLEKTTEENLLCIVESYLTSRAQSLALLPSPILEQLNTLGKDGSTSPTALIDTLMQWYDTCSSKERTKFWTMSLDLLMLPTLLGTPSRV